MGSLLRASVPWILILAALDTLDVRLEHGWRPTEPRLYLESLVIWSLFALGAMPPAALLRVWIRRRRGLRDPRGERARTHACLSAFLAGPIWLHATLDGFTALGGDLSGLLSVNALGAVAALVLVLALILWLVARGFDRPSVFRAFWFFSAAVALGGVFLPWRSSPVESHADGASRPNLLLMIWDTCRPDRLEPYGHGRPTTPHLSRLAEESVVFEQARSVAIFTFTSHLSLLTGKLPSGHGGRLISTRYDPRKAESISALLQSAGYRTGAFVGTDVLSGRTGIHHGFEVYDDQVDPRVCDTRAWNLVHDLQSILATLFPALRNNGRPHWIQDFQRPGTEVLANARAWIENGDPRPWFCFVNLYDVHWPYLPSEPSRQELVGPYDGPMDGFLFRSDGWQKGYEPGLEDRRHLLELYEGEILDLDAEVDRFLAGLDLDSGRVGLVLTSDHGEAFGEEGRWKHEDILEPQVRVPLIVRAPEPSPTGRRVRGPVTGVDVAPTLLGMAGITPPPGLPGMDLLAAAVPDDRAVLIEDRDHVRVDDVRVALYLERWKLVRFGLGEDVRFALHDLETDPVGGIDVTAEYPDEFERLKDRLLALREEADLRDGRVGEALDSQTDALRALGYVGDE